ncbi:MAG: hypothetical protein JF590_06330 [Gemmatimonadetes bacterium]|nr:hypothetical protein [Gemmatimonadota bacterium]
MFRSFLGALISCFVLAGGAAAQQRPRPQYQCGSAPSLDSVNTEGSRWQACENDYWGSVYLAAKMLNRFSGIDGNCLADYSTTYRDAARLFLTGHWAEANLAKARLNCAAGRQVRIDPEAATRRGTVTPWWSATTPPRGPSGSPNGPSGIASG